MMAAMHTIRRHSLVVVVLLFLLAQGVHAQRGAVRIEYTVSLSDPSTQEFHVTTVIKNLNQPALALSLPAWTPGWYTVENYFRNVLRFRITDRSGKILAHTMSKKQTWNVAIRGINEIKIDYDYRATILALNQAKITSDFAFFTGIELFLQVEGHRKEPSTIRFRIPSGWKIISALKETSDPLTFTAADYDTLVDAPTEMGHFDVTPFDVGGKPHYFVATPAGSFDSEKSHEFTEMVAKIIKADAAIFGGLPYDKYLMFYFFAPPESNAGGALEHLNSFVSFVRQSSTPTPKELMGTAAHEYFHLWNVKRIRPAEMWPYDYSRENETPLLWVSEGFTSYYSVVAQYRSGLMSLEDFLGRAAEVAASIENNEARTYISPAESSVSTWVGYDTPVAFGISYYTQGENLGALLDLSILNDTNGKRSLDDVMRSLFSDFYKRGRGFTTEDMIAVINRMTQKDYRDFYRRYVFGTEVPNYHQIFGYAGYQLEKNEQRDVDIPFSVNQTASGFAVQFVEPNSAASIAGLRPKDVIVKLDGQSAIGYPLDSVGGKTVKLTVVRDGKDIEIPMTFGTHTFQAFTLVSLPNPTPEQLRIRKGWLGQGLRRQ
jgi:predicted metalloprotease with PDZ domain